MLGGHEGDRGRPWVRAVCPGLPACVAARSPTSFRTMVAVRLSQQEQPHHCHGTREIDDGRHIFGLLVRAWYQALCQNAAENVVARQRPLGTGAVQPGPHLLLLPLMRITATVRFFRAVSAVRKQLATAEGLIGYTLRAKPLARDYWTLSVWKDDGALREFMRTPPHVRVMTSLKPFMGPTKFVTWSVSAADGRPSMAVALEHLAAG